ncbi:hypothetical protein MTO96_046132, partial [Rhipicephalus appendiculatus]
VRCGVKPIGIWSVEEDAGCGADSTGGIGAGSAGAGTGSSVLCASLEPISSWDPRLFFDRLWPLVVLLSVLDAAECELLRDGNRE